MALFFLSIKDISTTLLSLQSSRAAVLGLASAAVLTASYAYYTSGKSSSTDVTARAAPRAAASESPSSSSPRLSPPDAAAADLDSSLMFAPSAKTAVPIASGLLLSAALVLRARRKHAARAPHDFHTLHGIDVGRLGAGDLDGVRRVVEDLATRFAETDGQFVHRLRTETMLRVANGGMSAATARVALLALCRERDSLQGLSTSTDIVDGALVSGTLHGWYRAPHTDGSGVEVFYGNVTGKTGVPDGSKIHTTGATRIGNHLFTFNDKIYALGKEGMVPPLDKRVDALASRNDLLGNGKAGTLSADARARRGGRERRKSAVDMEQDALLAQFHARMLSAGRGGGHSGEYDDDDANTAAGEDGPLGASSIPLADYLFAHLKSEVIVLDTAGLAFIQREVDKLNLANDKSLPSADPMRGFRLAHNVIKRVVCEVCGFQRDGHRWKLGPSYSSFLDKVPRHQISAIWDAMRRLVVWYDNLTSGAKKFSATDVEVMANLPHLVLLARHVKMQMGIRSLMMSSRTAPSPAHRLQMQKSARELAKMHGHMSSFRGEADDIMAGRGGGKE